MSLLQNQVRLSVIMCTDPPQADTALQLEEAAVVEGVRWYDLPSFESYWPMQGVDGELQMQG